jgi:hypothetical protein
MGELYNGKPFPGKAQALIDPVAASEKHLKGCSSAWLALRSGIIGASGLIAGGSGYFYAASIAKDQKKTIKELQREQSAKELVGPLQKMSTEERSKSAQALYSIIDGKAESVRNLGIKANIKAIRGNLMEPGVLRARGKGAAEHGAEVEAALGLAQNGDSVTAAFRVAVESSLAGQARPDEKPVQTLTRLLADPPGSPHYRLFLNTVNERFLTGLFPGLLTSSHNYSSFVKEATRNRIGEEIDRALRAAR